MIGLIAGRPKAGYVTEHVTPALYYMFRVRKMIGPAGRPKAAMTGLRAKGNSVAGCCRPSRFSQDAWGKIWRLREHYQCIERRKVGELPAIIGTFRPPVNLDEPG